MRKDAREAVYKILYAKLFNENDENFKSEIFIESKLSDKDAEFADELLAVISEHDAEIAENIERLANGYSYGRIYSTVKCALLIAFAEMKYFGDIPLVVSIDEAMTLIRLYSDKDGMNFANGILAAYKKELEEENATD